MAAIKKEKINLGRLQISFASLNEKFEKEKSTKNS